LGSLGLATTQQQELQDGILWLDPLIQLNPAFEPGAWIDNLVENGTLHPLCPRISIAHTGIQFGKKRKMMDWKRPFHAKIYVSNKAQ
jgi:hypothetical protein